MIPRISPTVMRGLVRYVRDGILPGGFLRAVISNDLMEAACRADTDNATALSDIALVIFHHCPSRCFGSAKAMAAWSAMPSAARERYFKADFLKYVIGYEHATGERVQ